MPESGSFNVPFGDIIDPEFDTFQVNTWLDSLPRMRSMPKSVSDYDCCRQPEPRKEFWSGFSFD